MFSFILFIFLCFFGILAALYHMQRSQEQFRQDLREELARMRELLQELQPQSRTRAPAGDAGRPGREKTREPLDHLSLDTAREPQKPSPMPTDPALELRFEPAGENRLQFPEDRPTERRI